MNGYATYPTRVLTTDLEFGEGPRWRDGRMWFSDMFKGCVSTIDDTGRIEVLAPLHRPSGLGFMPDGRLLAVAMEEGALKVLVDGRFDTHLDLSFGGTHTLNDLLVLPSGDIYVDCYLREGRRSGRDFVAHISPEGVISRAVDSLRTPNGIVADEAGRTLYVAETFGEKIWKFSIKADGSLSDRQVFADLAGRHPDGLTLDAEGALWAGFFSTGEFLRIDSGGHITHRIETPGRWAVAPLLGGADGRTLFMFSADTDLETRFPNNISSGVLEVARVDVPAAVF